jgi:uncharacterized protein YbaA (DUF1428 family)
MRAWPADLQRITPDVVAVQFDEINAYRKTAVVSAAVTNEIGVL